MPTIEGVYNETTRKIQFQSSGAAAYLTIIPIKAQLTTSIEGPTVSEAMHRGRHISGQAPVAHDVGDNNITGSMSFYIQSHPEGVTPSTDAANPVAWLNSQRAAAAGLTKTGKGDAWCFKMLVVDVQPGSTQTTTYNYVYPEKPTESFDNGLLVVSFNFTDRETAPTVVSGDTTL